MIGTDKTGDAGNVNGANNVNAGEMSDGNSARMETGEMPRRRTWPQFVAALCVFAATAAVLHARGSRETIPASAPLSAFPVMIGAWTGQDIALTREQLAVLGPGDFLMRDYRWGGGTQIGAGEASGEGAGSAVERLAATRGPGGSKGGGAAIESARGAGALGAAALGGAAVNFYVAYYPSQRTGDTIHSPQNCLPGAGWTPLTSSRVRLDLAGGKAMVNRYVVGQGSDRMLVYYWYQAHGRVTASEYWAKIFLVTDAIRMNRTDGALVRVMAPFSDPSQEAKAQAETLAFIRQISPLLDAYIPR